MENNKRAHSLIEAKFRTNILIIEGLMLTKDIKTTKSDLVINKR